MHRRDARDYFEGDSGGGQHLRLFAATTKYKWIATLEADDLFALAGFREEQRIQFGLRDTTRAVVFTPVDDFCAGWRVTKNLAVYQAVIDDDFGTLQQFLSTQRQQSGVAGASAYQIDDAVSAQIAKSLYSGFTTSAGGKSMPAATVALVPGSMRMNEPVRRLVP